MGHWKHHHPGWAAIAPFWNAAVGIGFLIGMLAPLLVQAG